MHYEAGSGCKGVAIRVASLAGSVFLRDLGVCAFTGVGHACTIESMLNKMPNNL